MIYGILILPQAIQCKYICIVNPLFFFVNCGILSNIEPVIALLLNWTHYFFLTICFQLQFCLLCAVWARRFNKFPLVYCYTYSKLVAKLLFLQNQPLKICISFWRRLRVQGGACFWFSLEKIVQIEGRGAFSFMELVWCFSTYQVDLPPKSWHLNEKCTWSKWFSV